MGKTGTSTGGVEQSPRYRRKKAHERAAEEKRWLELSGPVVTYTVRPDDQSGDTIDARSVEAAAKLSAP